MPAWYRQAKATKRGENGQREVLAPPIGPMKPGNGRRTGPGGGKEGVESQNRCGETHKVQWNLKTC